jgi:uncharacterized membrane protein YqjE
MAPPAFAMCNHGVYSTAYAAYTVMGQEPPSYLKYILIGSVILILTAGIVASSLVAILDIMLPESIYMLIVAITSVFLLIGWTVMRRRLLQIVRTHELRATLGSLESSSTTGAKSILSSGGGIGGKSKTTLASAFQPRQRSSTFRDGLKRYTNESRTIVVFWLLAAIAFIYRSVLTMSLEPYPVLRPDEWSPSTNVLLYFPPILMVCFIFYDPLRRRSSSVSPSPSDATEAPHVAPAAAAATLYDAAGIANQRNADGINQAHVETPNGSGDDVGSPPSSSSQWDRDNNNSRRTPGVTRQLLHAIATGADHLSIVRASAVAAGPINDDPSLLSVPSGHLSSDVYNLAAESIPGVPNNSRIGLSSNGGNDVIPSHNNQSTNSNDTSVDYVSRSGKTSEYIPPHHRHLQIIINNAARSPQLPIISPPVEHSPAAAPIGTARSESYPASPSIDTLGGHAVSAVTPDTSTGAAARVLDTPLITPVASTESSLLAPQLLPTTSVASTAFSHDHHHMNALSASPNASVLLSVSSQPVSHYISLNSAS